MQSSQVPSEYPNSKMATEQLRMADNEENAKKPSKVSKRLYKAGDFSNSPSNVQLHKTPKFGYPGAKNNSHTVQDLTKIRK